MQKKFQKFRIASIQPTNNKHIKARALTTSGMLAAAIMMTGCSPTEGAQNEAANNANGETQDVNLLNVSYDVSRDFYKEYNALFSTDYQKAQPNSKVNINQSHGGSSKQALSVANGLQADVVTFNQESDMNLLVEKGLVSANWQQALPNSAVPYTSTMVLLVRAGNPKNIQDWSDLARNDIDVVTPNPKTSGTARYAFLGAYGRMQPTAFSELCLLAPVVPKDMLAILVCAPATTMGD